MKRHILDGTIELQRASDECIFHRGARGYSVAYAKGGRLHLPVKQWLTADFTWVRIPPCAKSVSPGGLELSHLRLNDYGAQREVFVCENITI